MGVLDLCPTIMWFQVHTIMQIQLSTLSQTGACGEAEKPRWDMAFLVIVPSTSVGGDQLFGLAVVWVHPHQDHSTTLAEAAQKLMLLVDDGPDKLYAFIHMSDTVLHMPLSENGHISTMMNGVCTVIACGWFHLLQVWKLLQHRNSIVFPEGLNLEHEALHFSIQELPLCNAASTDGPAQHPPMIEVVLSGIESETASTTQVPPPSWPPNLCRTSLQFSTYTSRGPWNSCSRHLLQSQQPPLSIACLEGSCCLWSWVLCFPLEQKIHSA